MLSKFYFLGILKCGFYECGDEAKCNVMKGNTGQYCPVNCCRYYFPRKITEKKYFS